MCWRLGPQTLFRGGVFGKWLDHEGSDLINGYFIDEFEISWYCWKVVETRRWGLVGGSRSQVTCSGKISCLFPFSLFSLLPGHREVRQSSFAVLCPSTMMVCLTTQGSRNNYASGTQKVGTWWLNAYISRCNGNKMKEIRLSRYTKLKRRGPGLEVLAAGPGWLESSW
jgi:hypothetical protein